MSNKGSKVLISLLIAASLALGGCGQGEDTPRSVSIAVSVPLGLDIGQQVVNGVQMALDEAGGKAGKTTVKLLVLDTSDPSGSPISTDLERQRAEQAAADATVVGYIGPMTSDQAKTSAALLNKASIVQITESATWPGLTKPGFAPSEPGIYYPTGRRHLFRVIPTDDSQAISAAQWALHLGKQRIYVLDDGTTYGKGISGIFEVAAQDVGLEILGHESLGEDAGGSGQMARAAERAVAARPDLIYFGGGVTPYGVDMVRALRERDVTLPIMAPDGMFQDELLTRLGHELSEGVYVTSTTVPIERLDTAAIFAQHYAAKYAAAPLPYVVGAYEATKVLLAAIGSTSSPTRENVLKAVRAQQDFSGVLGTWHFDPNGDITPTLISMWQVQRGQWAFVQVIE